MDFRICYSLLLFTLTFSLSASDEYFKKGHKALNKGQHTDAIDYFKEAAEQGHVEAQYTLGDIYESGKGVAKSYEQAAIWYKKAAEHDCGFCQWKMGNIYKEGQGVPKNYTEAVKYFRKGAELFHRNSQESLGDMYYHGFGVEKDRVTAINWYRIAGDTGNPSALYKIANLLNKGDENIEKNIYASVHFYREAAKQGHEKSKAALASIPRKYRLTEQRVLNDKYLSEKLEGMWVTNSDDVYKFIIKAAHWGELVLLRPNEDKVWRHKYKIIERDEFENRIVIEIFTEMGAVSTQDITFDDFEGTATVKVLINKIPIETKMKFVKELASD